MNQISIKVAQRSQSGRGASRRSRNDGKVPAVIYGHGGTRHVTVESADFNRLYKKAAGRVTLIQLDQDGNAPELSIIKQVQRDPITDRFLHVDFMAVEESKEMVAVVPVHVVGEAYGVKTEGGLLEIQSHTLKVRCLPRNLPEFITVDITEMKAGQSLHVKELKAIDGVSFRHDGDQVIVACIAKEEEKVEETAATPAAAAATPAPAKKK